jgi:hypothetical protein
MINYVSLISPTQENCFIGYQLKIGTQPTTVFRNSLMLLLKEKGLEMEEKENFILIYNAKQNNCFSHV